MNDVERLARLLCEADGFLPDNMVSNMQLERGPKGSQFLPEADYIVPAWALYAPQAACVLQKATLTYGEAS